MQQELYLKENLGTLIRTVPVCEGNVLELQWVTPCTNTMYACQPGHYLGHLLGHEGEGSIFHVLKVKSYHG